ncbi:MAG: inositol monophosphatase [Geobacteraceae bacterium]|nr:inositol monophosphatase [Geobacteraceae bacterium]
MQVDLLLHLAKGLARDAAKHLSESRNLAARVIEDVQLSGREVKIAADRVLDKVIIERLASTGISLLSEESGFLDQGNNDGLLWVIDPLDGSINYLRGVGPSAVSIALYQNLQPVFGVLCEIQNASLAWGGRSIGAWRDDVKIRVSSTGQKKDAILYSGIPARFDFGNKETVAAFNQMIFGFSKVRMIGSAACSLLQVASASADAYWEDNIMFWDVAAGIAIVEGAGGVTQIAFKDELPWATCVSATNAELSLSVV